MEARPARKHLEDGQTTPSQPNRNDKPEAGRKKGLLSRDRYYLARSEQFFNKYKAIRDYYQSHQLVRAQTTN